MSAPRIFTVAEAEATLPLVRRIVRDLQAEYPVWREAVGRFEVLSGGARADWGATPELVKAQAEIALHAELINGYLEELEQLSVVFKGFDAGLVDFYSLREDRLVFLCWHLAETRITHWHELDAGFSGRQPIDATTISGVAP